MSGDVKAMRDEILRRVQAAAANIAEVADHVQILATTQVPQTDETLSCVFGTGNIHARRGIAREWLDGQQEYDRESVRQSMAEE